MSLEKFHKAHFIQRLEALQNDLNEIIFASKGQDQAFLIPSEPFSDLSNEISCVLDRYGRVLQTSTGFILTFGYSFKFIVNLYFLDFVAAPKKSTLEYLDKLIKGFPMIEFENRIRCSSNELKALQWKGEKKGEYLYLRGKERKVASSLDNLQEIDSFPSEQNLRAIINSSNHILFLIDTNLKIITYNKHAQETVSKRLDKGLLAGGSFFCFIPRIDLNDFKKIYATVLKGETIHFTRLFNFKDSARWFEIYIQPVKDESAVVDRMVISALDITDRKITEEKFRELEINFKSIFSQVAVGIVLFNMALESEQANRRFYEMVEYTPEEYEKLGPLGVTHPEDRETSSKKLSDLIAGKTGHYSFEKRYVTNSGKIIWVLLTATLVKNRMGKPKHIISVIQDITARKSAEQELLYKKNELDTFVYRASHDLRGPVASLMGLYNIVKREFVGNEQVLTYFQHYNNSVMRLHGVLQNLVDLTKIKESENELSQVDIRELIDRCLDTMTALPNFKRIKFFIDTDLDFKIFIDGKKFKAILKNLVRNAIFYCTPEDKAFIKIKVSYQENVLKMEIIDNGRGIPPQIQNKVFNMFFRGSEISSGSGLGLYIVKNAVEKLNGSIQLTSQLNEGTKVSVYIPYLYEQEYVDLRGKIGAI